MSRVPPGKAATRTTVESIRAAAEAHTSAGRISNSIGSIASVCSCGLVFLRVNVADADNALSVHQSDALGTGAPSLTLAAW